jgi:hypothetical protein
MRGFAVLLVLLVACSDSASDEPRSAKILEGLSGYSFVEAEPKARENLLHYVIGALPPDVKVVDSTVRSVRAKGQESPGEVVAVTLESEGLEIGRLQEKVLRATVPGEARTILDGRGLTSGIEGTFVAAAFVTEDVFVYAVAPELPALKNVLEEMIRVHGTDAVASMV